MAGVSKYTDDDRARVNAALTINDGNVRRTARETGLPIATVRTWKQNWERAGVPAVVEAKTSDAIQKFIDDATDARSLAMTRLKEVIPMETKAKDLATVVGILDDKIQRAQGKPTSISQNQTGLPGPEEVRALFAGYALGALESSRQRERDILTADAITDAIEVE
jgi:transposase-like protein